MAILIIRFILYLIRWQLSTPILAGVPLAYKKILRKQELTGKDIWKSIIIANLVGAVIFYPIDGVIWIYLQIIIKLLFPHAGI
jgi:hypothetical protein